MSVFLNSILCINRISHSHIRHWTSTTSCAAPRNIDLEEHPQSPKHPGSSYMWARPGASPILLLKLWISVDDTNPACQRKLNQKESSP